VARSLGDRVAMILDGGPCTVGIESTVVDVTGPRPLILRPGGIDRAALEAVVGSVDVATGAGLGESPRASPGMMDRHYAPRAAVALFDAVQAPAVAAAMEAAPPGRHAAIVWSAPVASALGPAATVLAADAAGYARSLYEALHAVDRGGATHVSIERVPDDDRWAAVRDRLERAARSA